MALASDSTLARVSSQVLAILPLVLLLIVPNIFFLSSAGLAFCSSPWPRSGNKTSDTEDERRNAAKRRVAGREVGAIRDKMLLIFILARTALDLAPARAA